MKGLKDPMGLTRVLEWVAATVIVSVATVFAIMRFAYSDFETQRATDIYRSQVEKRLDIIQTQLTTLDEKINQLLSDRKK